MASVLSQYSPGLQTVALKYGNELFRLGAARLLQANRPEVSFPLPPFVPESDEEEEF